MQRIRSLLLIGAAVLLTGCSTYVKVVSDPEGATITTPDGSVVYGIAPLDVEYRTSDLERDLGRIPGFRAHWPSGAEASTESPFVVQDLRYGAQVTLKRPKDHPGREEDLQFALERAQLRAKEAEAEAERMRLYLDDGWFWGPPRFWRYGPYF